MDLSEFRNRIITIIVVSGISILLLLLDSIGVVSSVYNLTSLIVVPIRLEVRKLSVRVNDILGLITQISAIKEENERLKTENVELVEQLSTYGEVKAENEALRNQIGLSEIETDSIIEGRVIGNNIASDQSLQINIGSIDGVGKNDIVVFGKYAVGAIRKVDKYSSKVMLIVSSSSNIPVRGQKNRALGLIQGDVGSTLRMIDILPDEVVEVGEIIVTSGVDSEYPAGLIIGEVDRVDDNPANATKEAFVRLQIDFSKLDYIYVIRGQI